MYSSALDTVRQTDGNQLLTVEAFLMRSALLGDPAVLSPSQAIDSTVIQAIILGNDKAQENYFLKAVELGIVRVSVPQGCGSLIDYCIGAVTRGEEQSENAFLFSSFPFLYSQDYDAARQKEVLQYIKTRLQEARFRTCSVKMPTSLSSAEKETVEQYIEAIIQLDKSVRYYDLYSVNRNLFPNLLKQAIAKRLLIELPKKTALAELLQQTLAECTSPGCSVYRSYYYNFCEKRIHEFGAAAVAETKSIIDLCYNKVASLALKADAELNIDPDFSVLAASQADEENAKCSTITAVNSVALSEPLDWYSIVEIYREVDALCREKGLSWRDALVEYYHRQPRLPFLLGGKTLLITSLTMLVSSLPIVGSLLSSPISEFMWNLVSDEVGSALKKPSAKEIVRQVQQAKHNQKVLDIVVFSEQNEGGSLLCNS